MGYGEFYDRMIDWTKRLAREGPNLLALARKAGAGRVLDLACGTGEHALYLQQQGLSLTGVDLSEEAVAAARRKAVERQLPVAFVAGSFDQVAELVREPQDMVLCIGNSLPHLLSREDLARALGNVHRVLRPGGGLLLQVRNYHKVMGNKERFMPLNWSEEGEKEHLFLRMMDFLPDGLLDFHILHFIKEGGQWRMEREGERLRPVYRDELAQILAELGFRSEFWGDYGMAPFDPEKSPDLIVWAVKE